jgi:hypothetical protein
MVYRKDRTGMRETNGYILIILNTVNDETFINNYLDSNFEVKLVEDQPVIYDLYESKGIGPVMFKTCVNKIIGTFVTDDGRLSYHLVNKWLLNAYNKLNLGVRTYLLECKVVLTQDGWKAVNSTGQDVTAQTLINKYNITTNIEQVVDDFDKWWDINVTKAVEGIMR